MGYIRSVNPYNNNLLKEYEAYDDHKLNTILHQADKAFLQWKNVSFNERSVLMKKCGEHLLKNKKELAELITAEMGKPIQESIAEIEKCAMVCEYYALHAERFLQDEIIQSDASESLVSYQPLGCVLAVMPWNFPFWQVFRFAVPALMAGNTGILKHASNVPQCALAIEKVFKDSGFPDHVFQAVLIGSDKVKSLIDHPVIKATTLTGSEKAGSEVAMNSGRNIKKTVLELGGSDGFIVLKDADLGKAAEVAVKSRMINTGQSCIAAKRFIIVKEVYDEFLEKMKGQMEQLKMGDPMEEATDIGPMANEQLAKSLEAQVDASVKKGARIFWRGGHSTLKGSFVNPTMLVDIAPGMPAYEEEFFGPVAIILKAENEDDAIRIVNDSKFGLGASIWTKDKERGLELARRVEAGMVFVNGMVKSDPKIPFGGIKNSGYGRELSHFGIREFVNIKSIWIR